MTDEEQARLAALETEVAELRVELAPLRSWKNELEDGVRQLLAKQP